MALAVRLRRRDLTAVDIISGAYDIKWQDQLSEAGTGEFKLTNDDAQAADIHDGDIIQFELDGDVVAGFLVRNRESQTIAGGELADQVTTFSGPGLLALLDESVVFPARGVNALPPDDNRTFGWMSPEYDDGSWASAAALVTWGGVLPVGVPYDNLATEPKVSYWLGLGTKWDDFDAWWLWAPGLTSPREWAPAGNCYFRKTFTAPAEIARLTYNVIFDAEGEFWLDGQRLAGGSYGNEPSVNGYSGTVLLSPGPHTLAIRCANDPDPEADEIHNPGGIIFSAVGLDQMGNSLGVLVRSDDTWKVLAYPSGAPGMTAGQALEIVLAEGAARGALTGVSHDFTGALDSAAVSWSQVGQISTKVGTDLLSFVRELTDTYIDVALDPASLTLRAWNLGGRGQARTVTLHPPTDNTDPGSGNLGALTHRRVM